ncbi:class I SAM-dependent methyltransferase [Patescibacteria group bacterium]
MNKDLKSVVQLHESVPANWYYQSLKVDLLQRFWHKRRFKEVSKVIEKVDGEVLDIGCADGVFTEVILDKSKAKKITGIDVLQKSINWAKKHWKNNKKMKFMAGNAQDLKFKSNFFDAVFAMEMLEHVVSPESVLRQVKRVLKRGGYGVFLVPSDNFLFKIVWFLWLNFYPRGKTWKHTHIQTYKDNFLIRVSRKVGFNIEENVKFNLGMLQLVKVRK